jgi:peroxiredoxin
MSLLSTPPLNPEYKAPPFSLPDAWGRPSSLEHLKGSHATIIMFICHHCPYVLAIIEPLVAQIKKLQNHSGIRAIAIMSNDGTTYPDDAFEHMAPFAEKYNFSFPYLFDESQNVARAFHAVCTPDFFGFDHQLTLKYRGQFNESRPGHTAPPHEYQDLSQAIIAIAEKKPITKKQKPSIGCSIKWKNPTPSKSSISS